MNKPCTEPRLDELLGDPAMQLLMARDGVEETMLRRLLSSVRASRQGLRGSPVPPTGVGSV